MTATPAVSTLDAYERWAPTYPPEPHNPLMQAEQRVMLELWPRVAGLRVLDLACGTGRYSRLLAEQGAREVIALDFSAEMLRRTDHGSRVRASMMQLPFADAVFDVVVSGLAVGHADDIRAWASEVARVMRPGGTLLYSDFHADAARAGLVRSFKDETHRAWTVPHRTFPPNEQRVALLNAGFCIDTIRELAVGRDFTETFPGADAFEREWRGLPLLLIVRARRSDS
jgi:SAM-dependent methyltransferase